MLPARPVAAPRDLPAGVDGAAVAVRPAEGAQVGHRPAAAGRASVEEGVLNAARRVAPPRNLPAGVDGAAAAFRTAEGTQVVDVGRPVGG